MDVRSFAPIAGLAVLLGALAGALVFVADGPQPLERSGPVRVAVSLPPLAWPVEAIDPSAEVTVLVPPGASPHGHEPTPAQLAALADAELVILVGAGLEPTIDRWLADRRRADQDVVRLLELPGLTPPATGAGHICSDECATGHAHAHDGPGSPLDPHAWLDPSAMGALTDAVRDSLARAHEYRRSAGAEAAAGAGAGLRDISSDELDRRAAAARATIERVDAAYRRASALLREPAPMGLAPADAAEPLASLDIATHHNAYGWLADRYQLRVVAVARPVETLEPTPGQLAEAARAIERAGVRAIFAEPQMPDAALRRLAQLAGLGDAVRTLDPVGGRDWPATMRDNLRSLVAGLTAEASPPPGALPVIDEAIEAILPGDDAASAARQSEREPGPASERAADRRASR